MLGISGAGPRVTSVVEDHYQAQSSSDLPSKVADHIPYFVLYLIVLFLLIFPIWSVTILPWTDLGDHIARIDILHEYGDVPVFRQFYAIRRVLLPNLAIDFVGYFLLSFMGGLLAAKVFASLTIIVFGIGCHSFGRAVHGSGTWLAIPATFFFYNSLLLYGFVNYIWGVALFLMAAGCWLHFERARSVRSSVMATCAAFATFVAHLSGFFFLCVFITLMIVGSVVRERRLKVWHLTGFVPLVPSLIAYALLGDEKGDTALILWSTFADKLKHSWVLFSGYSNWMDAITLGSLTLAVAAIFIHGNVSIDRRMGAVFFSFLLAFCLFPSFLHTGADADTRFVLPAALVGLLALKVTMAPRYARMVYIFTLLAFTARVAFMTGYWHRADSISVEQIRLLDTMDEGSKVLPLVFLPAGRTESKIHQQLKHLTGYATLDRHAISPTTFATKGQQLLERRIDLPFWEVTSQTPANSLDWVRITGTYDYIWAYGAPPSFIAILNECCEIKARADSGRLYRTRKVPGA
jgi:hypothetical protein